MCRRSEGARVSHSASGLLPPATFSLHQVSSLHFSTWPPDALRLVHQTYSHHRACCLVPLLSSPLYLCCITCYMDPEPRTQNLQSDPFTLKSGTCADVSIYPGTLLSLPCAHPVTKNGKHFKEVLVIFRWGSLRELVSEFFVL